MDGHGVDKFRDAGLLATSIERPWTLLAAEIRSHKAGEISAFVPRNGEITQILNAAQNAISVRASGGVRQEVAARRGTTWLCPAGIREEATRLTADIPGVLHLYIPPHSFLSGELGTLNLRAQDLRYQAEVENPVVLSILQAITNELWLETAAGGLRIDALTVQLLATLASDHADKATTTPPISERGALDRRRADRVMRFIDANLDRDIGLADLADEACVSLFHFVRAFHSTFGVSPHAYLSQRRLDVAKRELSRLEMSLVEIALACRFSSQANFTRAFTRAVGVSPGRYRARLLDL